MTYKINLTFKRLEKMQENNNIKCLGGVLGHHKAPAHIQCSSAQILQA